MISNRDIRRQMAVVRRRGGLPNMRRWLELEREAIDRGLVVAQDCGCCMERWRTRQELREWTAETRAIRAENEARKSKEGG